MMTIVYWGSAADAFPVFSCNPCTALKVIITITLNYRETEAQLGDCPKATQLTRDGADI